MYISNQGYFEGRMETMKDGSYTAFHIQKMLNSQTGEPVYWIVGGKGRKALFTDGKTEGYIEPWETKLFIIPRSKLAGVPDTVTGAPDIRSLRIEVAQGNGRIVER
jgi:hypothetical protein